MKSDAALHGEVTTSHSVFGAPCWASLTMRGLQAAEEFYHAVLGWEWHTGATVGDQYRVASVHEVPVAGISEVNFGVNAWTPYFAVANADETVSRSQERGGTTAVGP
ncbi:VOC family protein, partial [Streptomyces sp. NPDC058086]